MTNREQGIKLERKAVSRIVLIVVLIGMLTVAFDVQPVAAQDWWPMFHHDLSHTGFSTSAAPDTNEVSWSYDIEDWLPVWSSPAVADGKVYVGSYNGKVYCFDAWTGDSIWSYTTGDNVFSSPAVADGNVYVGSDDGKVYCLRASDGHKEWEFTTGDLVESSLAVADGKVYVGSGDGKVYCLRASDGHKEWEFTTGGAVWSSPAVAYGRVYVGSSDHNVYCLPQNDPNDDGVIDPSEVNWNYMARHKVNSSPAVADDKVYIGSYDGSVYCLHAWNGDLIWEYSKYHGFFSSPAVAYGNVYIGTDSFVDAFQVYCLPQNDPNDDGVIDPSEVTWIYTTGGVVMASPAIADGKVYVPSGDGRLYCLDASTGDSIWTYKLTESPWYMYSSPAVVDGRVYLGTHDGKVYAFGPPTYTLTITTTDGGTTDPAPGAHTYACSSSVEVTAIPDACYLFDHWELDGEDVGSANPYSVLMDDDHMLHAVFVRINYDLTITATSGGTTDPAPGVYTYPCDSAVEVTAIPDIYYVLDHWELDGYNVGSANPYLVLMDGNHTLHAVFDTTYCQVSPTSLDFGTVTLGSYLDRTFTITNADGGTLTGSVSESCDHYSIVSGGGAYSLGAGESVTVTVRFEPTSLGQHDCTIETGNALCSDVSCTGVGQSPCQVSPTSLDFGTIMVGSYLDKSFTITNIGGDTLTGTVSESCNHYSIVSGEGAYILATGEYLTVTVRFEPVSPGQHNCTIETGNALCSDVYCTGVGRGEWYWKLPYDDYAPSGMPDIDQKQDNWKKEYTDQWTFCGPCAVANCFKWFDSKYNEGLGGWPGDGMDAFPLVRDYMDDLLPFYDWDDHDPWNVDHIGTQWNPAIGWPPETDQPFLPGPQPQPSGMPAWGELVERLAWYFDTDGIQTGYCSHAGTNILQMQQGIQDWLESETFEDGNTLADTLCAVITARPTFAYVESLVEKSENVILLLGFWYPGEAPIQQQFQQFIRGDFNENGIVDAGDWIMCVTGGPFSCDDATDANDDGVLSMTDCIYLSDYLYHMGPPPPPPYPNCELDPTPDELDCGSFALCGSWWRVGGHYATVAGVNSIEQKIALSDPFIDAAEAGLVEGRVGDGWLIEHVWGEHDPTVHNDEGNVSHDIYAIEESHDPCGLWRLVDYAVSSDPYYWTENFFAQNVPEEFLAVTQQWDGVSPIFTEVEYCVHISPWDYRGDVQPIGGDGVVDLGDLLFLINYLYKGGPAPAPLSEGDVNCDGIIDLGDVLFLISYLYKGGSVPRCCEP